VESCPLGGAYVLDGLWHRLGIDKVMANLCKGRRLDQRVERVLFGLVANRALAPSSKLAAATWITNDVHIDGLPATSDDACYRAMDWLHDVTPALEREVFWQLASLLDLEVDLLFFDTTSTYFELDEPDEPVARDERGQVLPETENGDGEKLAGFRSYGKSKVAIQPELAGWVLTRSLQAEPCRRAGRGPGRWGSIVGPDAEGSRRTPRRRAGTPPSAARRG
jgi:hypothetical protein